MSGVGKIITGPEGPMAKEFVKYGLEGKLGLIAAGEIISALLFLIPRTGPLGVLLLSGHMGGAIATHMEHGESYIVQAVILLLVWVAAFIRFPEMFRRLGGES